MPRLPRNWEPPIARRQHGLFTPAQALDAGATADQVRRRRENGAWRHVAGDAWTVSATPSARIDVRAVGLTWPDAIVCLGAAARFHGLPVADDGAVDVVIPRRRRSRDRLRTHRYPIPPTDALRYGSAWVTTLSRTLTDCIGRLSPPASESLVAWALTRDLLTRDDLAEVVAARPGAWGNTQRQQAYIDTARGAIGAAERRLHAILDRAGIDGWAGNQQVRDRSGRLIGRVDVLFAAARLIVEIDGRAHHGDDRFQDDRARQNRLVEAGYTVLRFTWLDLVERPHHVATQIRSTLRLLASR